MRLAIGRLAARFGALVGVMGFLSSPVLAGDPFHHTIPRVTYAQDYNTGAQYYAPAIPSGHYTKDTFGHLAGHMGAIHGLTGKLHGGFGHGGGCGACGGAACGGAGCGGVTAGDCGPAGCGLGGGHGHAGGCGLGGCGLGGGHGHAGMVQGGWNEGDCGPAGCGTGAVGHHGGGLGGKFQGLHGKLGGLGGLLHHGNKVEYFMGPGGPVPLTPGYVPYIVTTRSPRDFFSFPPYTPE